MSGTTEHKTLNQDDKDRLLTATEKARWSVVRTYLQERYGADMVTEIMVSNVIIWLDDEEVDEDDEEEDLIPGFIAAANGELS